MHFGDLMGGSLPANCRRNARYFRYMAECGIKKNDPLYQYFGVQAFHDSPFRMAPWSPASRELHMRLRNIYASDIVNNYEWNKHVDIPRSCFETRIVFHRIGRLSFIRNSDAKRAEFYQAVLGKDSHGYTLQIDLLEYHRIAYYGCLTFSFESAEIEDITSKIRKYLGEKSDDRCIWAPLIHKPEWYADFWIKRYVARR